MRSWAGESLSRTASFSAALLPRLSIAVLVAAVVSIAAGDDRVLLPAAHPDETLYEWVPMLPHTGFRSGVWVRPGSNDEHEIWVVGVDHGVYRGRRAPDETEWTWRRFEPPRGFEPRKIAPGPRDEIYVAGNWDDPVGSTLLFLRGEGGEWVDLDPPLLGPVFGISVTNDGTVWVTGEWRGVFRLAEDGTWQREVTPLPLHNHKIKMFDDGSGWIAAHSQTRSALYYRENGRWVVADKSNSGFVYAFDFATKDFAFYRDESTLISVSKPGGSRSREFVGIKPQAGEAASFSSSESGYWTKDGKVFRLRGDEFSEVRIVNPLRVGQDHDLFDRGRCGLFARGSDQRFYELRRATSRGHTDFLNRNFHVESSLFLGKERRFFGLSIVRMAGRNHLYLVDHEGPNAMLLLSSQRAVGPLVLEAMQTISDRLGITGEEERNSWIDLYDTTAVAGDLNGDGNEEIFVVSMYGENTLYRNVRDRHFVSWQKESRSNGLRSDMTTGACLLDADGDGDLDLYVTSIYAQDKLLLNNGAASFTDATARSGIETHDSGETPRCVDLDGDGDTDIAVATFGRGLLIHENLGRDDRSPHFETHALLAEVENPDGAGSLSTSYISSIAAADLDADGLPEILLGTAVGCDRLLWNEGNLNFDDRPESLPSNQACAWTAGAEFSDIDNDGDLDLILTGRGGVRLYENDGGGFSWDEPPDWAIDGRPAGRNVRGAVSMDIDNDGDLDLFYGQDSGLAVWRRNRTNDDRYIEVGVDGPPANRSAIGATVRLYPAGKAGLAEEMIAWRTIPPAGGYHSQGRRQAHFGGVEPGLAYDLVVDLPGAKRRVVRNIVAPSRARVALSADRLSGTAVFRRAAHFFGDPWNRRWAASSILLTVLLIGFGWLLFRSVSPRSLWMVALFSIPLGFVLFTTAPVDPGAPALILSIALPGVIGIVALSIVRARAAAKPLPELLVEVDLALRAFRHNQTPRKVADRLRFVLENISGKPVDAGTRHAHILIEDLSAHREVVLPELVAIARLARAASLLPDEWKSETRKQSRLVAKLLSCLRQTGSRVDAASHRELAASLERIDQLAKKTRSEVDTRLSVDLSKSLANYVASRKRLVPCDVEVIDDLPVGLRVRFMRSELYRLLDILLENAMQAMESIDKPLVAIEAVTPMPNRARIMFRDRGPGVSPDDAEEIFRAGYTKREGGSGFGLFWARRTLERFGGSIRAVATGSGACFEIDFDVLRSDEGGRAEERSA